MSRFIAPGCAAGWMLARGTIDLDARVKVHIPNPRGGISNILSFSRSYDPDDNVGKIRVPASARRRKGFAILLTGVIGSGGSFRIAGVREAEKWAFSTGNHLGIFTDWPQADAYGVCLHNWMAKQARKGR